MKKILIVMLLAFASCSDEDPEPSPVCKNITELYNELEREIEVYRVTPGADRAVLADMREELKQLATLKDQSCK